MVAFEPKRATSRKGYQVYIAYTNMGKTVYYDLYECDDFDRGHFVAKNNCELYRVGGTIADVVGYPLVSIDMQRNTVYFLRDYDTPCDNQSAWENRGRKLHFDLLRVLDDAGIR